MLTVRNLHQLSLSPVSFNLGDGECIAVLGSSGSGKSLLLRAIADLDPNRGEVMLNGELREAIPAPQWRRRVVYVSSESGWWHDDVAHYFTNWEEAIPWIEALRLPASIQTRTVSHLSTGERQRLALVRALILHPWVLLLDEPTSGLDSSATSAVEQILKERLRRGTSILWVTHAPERARRVAERGLLIEKGHTYEQVL